MKMSIISIILLFAASGCQQKNKITDNCSQRSAHNVQSQVESFDQFSRQFFSDSIFQMERIIFPLESDYQTSSPTESEEEADVTLGEENWVLLRNNYFLSPDTTLVINGIMYKKRVLKTDTSIEESIFIEDSGFSTTLKFSLKKGKWYLVDYIECDD